MALAGSIIKIRLLPKFDVFLGFTPKQLVNGPSVNKVVHPKFLRQCRKFSSSTSSAHPADKTLTDICKKERIAHSTSGTSSSDSEFDENGRLKRCLFPDSCKVYYQFAGFMFRPHKEMSEVWKYFERFDDKENKHVQCMLCKSKLKFTSSTSVMWNHLKCKHASCVALNKISNKRSLDTSTDSTQNVPTKQNENQSESLLMQDYPFFQLADTVQKVQDEPTKKKFTYHTEPFRECYEDTRSRSQDTQTSSIAKMLIEDLLPVSTIEGTGFKSLILSLNKVYNLPTRKEIKSQIQYLYEVEKLRLENIISKTQHVSLTTNCWKDSDGDNYVTVSLHAVMKDWSRVEYTLHSQFLGRNIGDNIKSVVDSVIHTWDLQYKVLAVVHDDPGGIYRSYKSPREVEKNILCFGYLLNKSLNVGFSMAAENLITTCVAIIDRILYLERTSISFIAEPLRSDDLFRSDGKSWISIYKMFESMLDQRNAITGLLLNKAIFVKSEDRSYELSEYNWALIENLKNIICPFALSTDLLKSDKIPTLSTVNPLISTLIDNFLQIQIGDCDEIGHFKATVTRELRTNFNLQSDGASLRDLCTFFDPRYKKYQRVEGLLTKVVNLVECLISVIIPDADAKKTETLVDFLFPREVAGNHESEIEMYANEVEISKNMCPLQWWKYNEHRFPFIAKLASKYLSIPATSVLPWRVFGVQGDAVGAKKAGLENVSVEYFRGLPQITVPLPSRRERCKFTLKPITNNVGDLITMLKTEDRGIDRVVALAMDDTRIAASNTIENLLDEDFKLVINDHTYVVRTPKQTRITGEEARRLDDIKTLVSQLYEALNVQEYNVQKEKDLTSQLEVLRQELMPLEEQKDHLDMIAQRKSDWMSWIGLGLMSVQFGILARLTWWEYSWDIMEPVTYFVTYGTAMAGYAYFVLTKQEYVLKDVKDRQQLLTIHKKAKKAGLDLTQYNHLKEQISVLERDLYKLQHPLKLHLPNKSDPTKKTSTDAKATQ